MRYNSYLTRTYVRFTYVLVFSAQGDALVTTCVDQTLERENVTLVRLRGQLPCDVGHAEYVDSHRLTSICAVLPCPLCFLALLSPLYSTYIYDIASDLGCGHVE